MNEQDMTAAWIRSERERVAADLAQSKKQHAERLAAMVPPPRDPMEEWRRQAAEQSEREARADRQRRASERAGIRAAALPDQLASLRARVDDIEQELVNVLKAVNTVTTALDGALGTLSSKLGRLDAETKQSFADVFGRLVHCLELIQPAQPQATRPADRLRSVN